MFSVPFEFRMFHVGVSSTWTSQRSAHLYLLSSSKIACKELMTLIVVYDVSRLDSVNLKPQHTHGAYIMDI